MRAYGWIVFCAVATVTMTATSTTPASATAPPSGRILIAAARAATGSPSTASAAGRYWTAERMRKATPVPPGQARPRTSPATSGTTGLRVARAEPVKKRKADDDVVAAVGRVFFHNPVATADVPAGDHVCTAAAVNSDSKELVITAGRCVHGGAGGDWYEDWIFVPGYRFFGGLQSEPYGVFSARLLGVEDDWGLRGDPAADVGMVQTAPNGFGRLVDVVGGMGLEWSDPLPPSVTVVGYAWSCFDVTCWLDQALCSASPQDGGPSTITLPCGYEDDDAVGSPWLTGFDGQLGDVNGTVSVLGEDGTETSPYYGEPVYQLYQEMGAGTLSP